jgi:hypothetical protein
MLGSWFTLRPTFEVPISVSRDLAMQRLMAHYQLVNQPSRFFIHGEYGELHLPPEQHRLWSPHLTFYVSSEVGQPRIHGRFAPRLEIWTFVWVLYLAMAFTAFFSFAMAFSQWAIGEQSWWHWLGFVSAASIFLIYAIAQVGQQWSSDQMETLRNWLEDILREASLIGSANPEQGRETETDSAADFSSTVTKSPNDRAGID